MWREKIKSETKSQKKDFCLGEMQEECESSKKKVSHIEESAAIRIAIKEKRECSQEEAT